MGRLRGTAARAFVTLALFVLLPALGLVERGVRLTDGGAGITLTTGLLLAYVMFIGPVGVPIAFIASLLELAIVRGQPVTTAVVVELSVKLLAVLLTALVLEARSRHHGGVRTPGLVVEFVVVAGVMLPLAANGVVASVQSPTLFWHAVIADGLGVLLMVPGLRVLVMREALVISRRDRIMLAVVAAFVVAVLVPLLLLGGPLSAGESQIVLLPLLLIAARVGTAPYAAGITAVQLAIVTPLALFGTATLQVGVGGHASWWMVTAGGLLISAEGDRSQRITREYQALFNYGTTPTAEVDRATGTIRRVNDALAAITGWSPTELSGSVLGDLIVPAQDDSDAYASLLSGERDEVHGYVNLRCRDGELRWVRLSGRRVVVGGPQPDPLLVQLHDLTVERAREDALRRSNEALERFGRRVSHDLKQPLAAIAGYAATLLEHADKLQPDVVDTMHERLDASARRAVHQLDEMFEGTAVASAGRGTVALGDLVSSVVGLVGIELSERGGVVDTSFVVPKLQTDPSAVQQVLLNLVTNSLKYSDHTRAPRVRIASRVRGAGVEITVTDNGTGIPAEEVDEVFVAGSRLAPGDAPGRGMGLADSRAIIEGVGGWLQAEPWVGGARFVIWLPDPSAAEQPPPVRVLLVDDDVDHRNIVALRLQLEDRLEVVGEVGTIAAAVAETARLRPDVVLLDRWLPDGDGLDAIGALGEAHPEVRVVVLTSDGTPGLDSRAREGGAARLLAKGRPGDELVEELVGVAG